jgi:hypothetical protein
MADGGFLEDCTLTLVIKVWHRFIERKPMSIRVVGVRRQLRTSSANKLHQKKTNKFGLVWEARIIAVSLNESNQPKICRQQSKFL